MINKKNELILDIKSKMMCLDDYTDLEENLLIESALNISKSQLMLKQDFSREEKNKIKYVLKKRLSGEPLNKIFKYQYFYKYKFYINKNVLAPRKETEILTEMVINEIKDRNLKVLDLCCGSGCIGLCIAKENKNCSVLLSDYSFKALYVAKKNKKLLNISNTGFVQGDMFGGLKIGERFDIITCNPPYISSSDCKKLSKGVLMFDPLLALNGGEDGLKFYKIIAQNVDKYLNKNGKIYLEIGFNQKDMVEKIFNEANFKTKCFKDYSNLDRIIVAQK